MALPQSFMAHFSLPLTNYEGINSMEEKILSPSTAH